MYQRLGGKRERAALGAAFNSAEPLAEYVVKAGACMAAALDQDGEPLQESVLGLLLNDWAIELAAETWADATNEAVAGRTVTRAVERPKSAKLWQASRMSPS